MHISDLLIFAVSLFPLGPGQTNIRSADPSVIRVGGTYISAEAVNGNRILVRQASSPLGLQDVTPVTIWSDTAARELWAPEIVQIDGIFYIYFTMGEGEAHRMYVISSSSPVSGYSAPRKLELPADRWAIDGLTFVFNNQRYFVWSGWEDDSNVEQNLYIARMNSPDSVTGPRYIISQPREAWERVVGNPFINEAPAPIIDPNRQLHIVYSANGSWSDQYCLADLRLRAGGDPTYVWDWYKSNGCQFGSNRSTLMEGWDPTLYGDGPGSHSFVLLNGDIATSPPAGPMFPLMYHAVPKGTPYSWESRMWFSGAFQWWGNATYTRQSSPGANSDTGFGLKFYEDPNVQ